MKKLNIGIEAQRLFRPDKHGMDIVALELIKNLQTIDKYNQYFIYVKAGSDDSCIEETDNFNIKVLPGYSYADWEQFSLARQAKKDKLDLLHCTANTAPVYVGVPIVITLHDIIYLEQISFKGTAYQNFGNLYRRWVVPKIIKKTEKLITVSEFEKQNMLQKLDLNDDFVEVVYNGVNPIFHVPKKGDSNVEKVKKEYNLPEDYIFFLGNMAPKKNMRRVLKAYKSYLERGQSILPLVVAETKEPELQQLLKSLNLEDIRKQILLTGYIPQAKLPVFYSQSKLFLYPSLRESFGLPIIEAMACGTPVITSNTSSMPEVSGGAARLIDPNKTEELAKAMIDLTTNSEKLDLLRTKGLENAQRFSWYQHALGAYELYMKIMGIPEYALR